MAALARIERGAALVSCAGPGPGDTPQSGGLGGGVLWLTRATGAHPLSDVRLVWPAPDHRLLWHAHHRLLRALLQLSVPGDRLRRGAGLLSVCREVSAGDA